MKSVKSKITTPALFVLLLLVFSSCEGLKDKMNISLDVPESSVEFDVGGKLSSVSAMKVASTASASKVLLEKTIDINLADVLKDNGYSFDNIKSFQIVKASLELVAPEGFDMDNFKNLKLYFDDQTQLVAEAESVNKTTAVVTIKIVSPELLEKLESNQLHIIVTGDKIPEERVTLRLKTKYRMKLNVLK